MMSAKQLAELIRAEHALEEEAFLRPTAATLIAWGHAQRKVRHAVRRILEEEPLAAREVRS